MPTYFRSNGRKEWGNPAKVGPVYEKGGITRLSTSISSFFDFPLSMRTPSLGCLILQNESMLSRAPAVRLTWRFTYFFPNNTLWND